MTAPATLPTVERYVARVGDALADLDAGDRDDLLGDLRGHLEELAVEEPDASLESRLGKPEEYAEELRLAARLPAAQAISAPTVGDRLTDLRVALTDRVRAFPAGNAVLSFLPELRPGWWVLRAWGAIGVLDFLLHRNSSYRFGSSVLPVIRGNRVLGLAVLFGLIVLSVRIGRRTPTGVWRVGLVVANAVLAIATLNYAVHANRIQFGDNASYSYSPPCCQLQNTDGSTITNIYPYDDKGRPLNRVQLFDQNGAPIGITGNQGTEGDVLHNVYPQTVRVDGQQLNPDGTYATVPEPAPTVAVPVLGPTPVATVAPSPHPTPSPAPSPS